MVNCSFGSIWVPFLVFTRSLLVLYLNATGQRHRGAILLLAKRCDLTAFDKNPATPRFPDHLATGNAA